MAETFKLLACVALSPRLRAVAGEAAALARLLGAELHFVHAGEDSPSARQRFEETLPAACAGQPFTFSISDGKPDAVVRREADRIGADLVLAGSLKTEGILKDLFGSVSRRIVRSSTRSVILLSEPVSTGSAFDSVVVNVPLDDAPEPLTRFAIDFCRRAGTKHLHAVYSTKYQDRLMQRYGGSEEAAKTESLSLSRLGDLLLGYDTSGFQIVPAVLTGADGLETIEYAQAKNADLVIFPAPSRELGFWDRYFRHPTEVVMQRLPKSILFFRDPNAQM